MTDSPQTRVSLILRLQSNNDAEAWQQFVEIYGPLVFRIAKSRGLQAADAHDVSQEVLVRVAKSIGQWQPDPSIGSFRGWLSRIARNLVIDFLRNKNRLPRTTDNSDIRMYVEQVPDRSAESQLFDIEFEKQVFAWAADQVKPSFESNTWHAFWLTAVDSIPVAEVADQLGLSRGAVYIARSRVMARLKKTIDSAEHPVD